MDASRPAHGRISPTAAIAFLLVSGLLLSPALAAGPAAAQGTVVDRGTSVEGCIGCHAAGEEVPVVNVRRPGDAHFVDLDPRGPASASGYRQVNVTPTRVDVTGSRVVVDFTAKDAAGNAIAELFASDGRFNIARLVAGAASGDPTAWQQLIPAASRRYERFTTPGGDFRYLGGGLYRYSSVFDPSSVPIASGDTLRVAVQVSAGDLPPGNGWCDFDASLTTANDCTSAVTRTRDIVQTATCNGCHGVTSDTMLRVHGGRTRVEYCVTCHNPGIGETDMTPLIHKIHYGAELTADFRGGEFAHVQFTRDIDDCTSCHTGGGADEDNWKTVPNRTACGSCHDDVDFDTGANHGAGGPQPTNRFCTGCHPSSGSVTGGLLPVPAVHRGMARAAEAGLYRGAGNGYALESVSFDLDTELLTIDFSVTRSGQKMDLAADPRWSNGARLAITVGWSTEEYTNEGSGSAPAPAQPVSVNGLDVGGAVSDLGNGSYRTAIDVSSFGFDTLTIGLEGHPQADLAGDGTYESIPVRSVFEDVNVEIRGVTRARRRIVDVAKCNLCHDAAGAGLALHGDNRVGEVQVCVVCHNPDATDIRRRPADPTMALDGKREVPVDMKRMIHQIHAGRSLDEGLVVYGFGNRPHDFSRVGFTGNLRNCLTCHLPGTYGLEDAWRALATTVHTGADVADPADDLNISQTTSVCSSCHDDAIARDHMLANGGSFIALDEDIATAPVPEPASLALSLAALCTLLAVVPRRRAPIRDPSR